MNFLICSFGILLLSCNGDTKKETVHPAGQDNIGQEVPKKNPEQQQVVPRATQSTPLAKKSVGEVTDNRASTPKKHDNGTAKKEQQTIDVRNDHKEEIIVPEEVMEENQSEININTKEKVAAKPFVIDHSAWNTLLKKYVDKKGNVNYSGFKNDIAALESYLVHLSENPPKAIWGKNEKLAYYINLYNAATVKLIIANYPTKSIKDIPNRWKKKWIAVGNTTTSLNDIEHEVLRKMNEPRIHFAINCASYSCPKLLNVAFTAQNMEKLLEEATNDFINDPTKNQFSGKKVGLSKIFKWYKSDFTQNTSLLKYINKYLNAPVAKNTGISYLDYDWSLNEAR